MEADNISAQHLRSQFGDHLAIDGNDTCLDEFVSLTTAANTGISQILIQTDGLVGIEVLLLILDALLHAVLGMRIVIGCTGTLIEGAVVAIRLIEAALLEATTLLTITAALLVATLLAITATLLVAALTGLVATTLLVAALFTFLVIGLLAVRLVIRLIALVVATTLLIAAALLVTALLTIAATLLVAAALLVTALLTRGITLQSSTKALGTEAALIVVTVISGTILSEGTGLSGMYTGTRRATRTILTLETVS